MIDLKSLIPTPDDNIECTIAQSGDTEGDEVVPDKSNLIEINFTIWNKDKNCKLMLNIINDTTRKGVEVEGDVKRKRNTLKERLLTAFANPNHGHENYKLFAESLDIKKGNRIYTKLSPGMVSAKIEK